MHVGLQKTGTSYLQAAMLASRDALREQGLDLVPATKREAFELMLLVRERYHAGRDPDSVPEALDRFTAALRAASGPAALLSQESLAAARPRQVERFLAACADREVHVVLTARDLGRQVPSSWQQEVKAGRTVDYGDYLHGLQESQREGRGTHPWIHLDPPAVLARWARHLPPERIHVVTVPPRGSSPTLLLERFCGVLDLDPSTVRPEEDPANTSIGRVQAEVLRRVNLELPDDVRRRQVYGNVGKRWFAAQVLSAQDGAAIRLPQALRPWAEEVADAQISALAAAGYDIVGDLADLRCAPEAFEEVDGTPDGDAVAAAAVTALAAILTEQGRTERSRPAERTEDRARWAFWRR
ncbi:hypothetical protein [Nocardioides sambongensis]|uniref:hypothetical protein n=1 Tax=Nocardioides sambongensis TaxID=2589074 RepID=UPI0015E84430|nr:hypothetical protein [Nocardioides sambongensis]